MDNRLRLTSGRASTAMEHITLHLKVEKENMAGLLAALKKFGADVEVSRKEISLSQAIKKYGWSKRSLYRWAKEEKLLPFRQHKENGVIWFRESDLEAFAAGGGRKGTKNDPPPKPSGRKKNLRKLFM